MTVYNRIFNVQPSPNPAGVHYQQKKISLPGDVDLREWDSPVEDQGALGSCVSHAVTSAYELMKKKQTGSSPELSRLFVYYHSRYLEKTLDLDSGVSYLKTAMDSLVRFGVCSEDLCPYIVEDFKKQPTPDCYSDACSRRIQGYMEVTTLTDMLENITLGKPILLGMSVYDSFMNIHSENSTVPLPEETETSLGGHAVLIVGYSMQDQTFLIKNSFGTSWASAGYARLPFEYVRLYAFDKMIFDIN
jgi:C1A family cysteine protease